MLLTRRERIILVSCESFISGPEKKIFKSINKNATSTIIKNNDTRIITITTNNIINIITIPTTSMIR